MQELVEYFGNRPTVLLGHSLGGSMAMLGSSVIEPVTHMISIMSNTGPSNPSQKALDAGVYISTRDTPKQYEENDITFHLPLSYFEEGNQYDFAKSISENNKPKLFMYGSKDLLVPKDTVEKSYQLASDPKEICGLDCGHDYRNHPEIIDEVNKRVGKFLETHN